MKQSIVQLPESLDFEIDGWQIIIRNHRITSSHGGLFGRMVCIAGGQESDKYTLAEFEKHGINFETVIECSVSEFEDEPAVLADLIWSYAFYHCKHYNVKLDANWPKCMNFSNSEMGLAYAQEFTNKIRNCKNWGELYDEMHPDSRFSIDIRCRILKEFESK